VALRSVAAPTPKAAGKIAFVIDDAGYALSELDPFLDLPGSLSIAVLPGLPHSAEAARRARRSGKTVYLHYPMEPEGPEDPGPDAILTGMTEETIRDLLGRALDEIGPVQGLNNHMGSLATADEGTVQAVLSVTRDRGLVFLDSRTTVETVAPRVAARVGVRMAERDVFLDGEPGIESIRLGMEKARATARKKGHAVVIGHVQNPELAAYLARELPALAREGFTLVSPGDLALVPEAGR
jgi:hypothetical protein